MSGWAVLALVTALIVVAASVLTLYWWLAAIPLGLAAYVLLRVSPRERRGRVLAVIGLVIALCAASCSYLLHNTTRTLVAKSSGAILGALASTGSPETQEQAIARWLHRGAIDAGLVATLRTRFAELTERFGAYRPPTEAGTLFGGLPALGMQPDGVVEVPPNPDTPLPVPGEGMWARAQFGEQTVHVLIVIDADLSNRPRPDGTIPWVRDVRFFATPAGS